MNDLLILTYFLPQLIIFVLLFIGCHFAKKYNIRKKQLERENRQALRRIARDKELDEQIKYEFSQTEKPVIIRHPPKMQEIYDYIKENVKGV